MLLCRDSARSASVARGLFGTVLARHTSGSSSLLLPLLLLLYAHVVSDWNLTCVGVSGTDQSDQITTNRPPQIDIKIELII